MVSPGISIDPPVLQIELGHRQVMCQCIAIDWRHDAQRTRIASTSEAVAATKRPLISISAIELFLRALVGSCNRSL